jgi:hypothetical protein
VERLNVLNGTIESLAALVLLEMITPVTDVPFEFVPTMVTPLFGALALPGIILWPLSVAVVLLELTAGWLTIVVVPLELVEALVPLPEALVLVTPGTSEVVDPELTKLAVLDPIVEPTPLTRSVVAFGGSAVLESDVLWIPPTMSPAVGVNVLLPAAELAASLPVALLDPDELAEVTETGWATLDARWISLRVSGFCQNSGAASITT